MSPGASLNIYSPADGRDLPTGVPRVFISHRSLDKPLAIAVAAALEQLGVHYWLDRNDEDVQRAASLGLAGDQALVHAIDRGMRHCTHLLGLLSADTRGSWWVPYEIGAARASGTPVCYLVLESIRQMAALPEYVRLAANFWSVDELFRWIGSLGDADPRPPGPSVDRATIDELGRYLPVPPPAPTPQLLAVRALRAIETLAQPATWAALALPAGEGFAWMPTTGGLVRDLAYDLLAPLALFELQNDRLTPRERELLGLMRTSVTRHYEFAAARPALTYNPEAAGWRQRRYRSPASCWLQGLSAEQLRERLRRFLIVTGIDRRPRLATREEFKTEFDRILAGDGEPDKRSLGVLVNPLFGFTPSDRPVYWRILAHQHRLLNALVQTSSAAIFDAPTMASVEQFATGRVP